MKTQIPTNPTNGRFGFILMCHCASPAICSDARALELLQHAQMVLGHDEDARRISKNGQNSGC